MSSKHPHSGGGKPHPSPHDTHASDQKRDVSGNIYVRGEVEVKVPVEEVHKHDADNEKKNSRDKKRFVVEIVGVVLVAVYAGLTAVQTYFVIRSTNAARTAAEAAKKQSETGAQELEESERPWLTIAYDPAEPMQFTKDKAFLLVNVRVENVGHSVAQAVRFRNYLIPSASETGHDCDSKSAQEDGVVVLPGQTFTTVMPTVPAEHRAATPEGESFDFLGCVFYTDSFTGKAHLTQRVFLIGRYENVTTRVKNATPGVIYESVKFIFQTYGSQAN